MKIRLSSVQVLALGFAALILLGGVLLWLPIANRDGIPFLDALFTATSATCVTGLVLYDTFSQFTWFGQVVILTLIQVGGLGFVMMGMLFSLLSGRRIGLRERALLMDSVGAMKLSGIVRATKQILIAVGVIEGTGAVLLATRFCKDFDLLTSIWYGIFHSVSAFCNAGFDLMGRRAAYSSMTAYVADPVVNLTITALIILGGLGFFLWIDVLHNKTNFHVYQLHTKLMLTFTAGLLVLGTALFWVTEQHAAFEGMSTGQQLLAAFFQSVTPRTAGFNTVDMTTLSDAGAFLTILLMLVGAGSGSTGGGIKVTTLAMLVLFVRADVRRWKDLNVFHRRLEGEVVRRACSVATLHVAMSAVGCIVLCMQGFSMKSSMFESMSAISTVGLSMGITPFLPTASRIAMMVLMYVGRLGSVSVFMAMAQPRKSKYAKNIMEKIVVG